MRIALHPVGEVGRRAGLILLAERDLAALGLYGPGGARVADRRTIAIRELTGFDPLVTDDVDAASALAGIACDDGLSCVVTGDEVEPEIAERFRSAGRTLLLGANLAGIARSLAAHEAARTDAPTETSAAWTLPGKPLRRGEAVAFPEPVGARWGEIVTGGGGATLIRVPIQGEWAGASATVIGGVAGERVQRVVGIADLASHLDGIALAAGALVVAEGSIPPGVHRPGDHAEAYLAVALRLGLEVAAHSSG